MWQLTNSSDNNGVMIAFGGYVFFGFNMTGSVAVNATTGDVVFNSTTVPLPTVYGTAALFGDTMVAQTSDGWISGFKYD